MIKKRTVHRKKKIRKKIQKDKLGIVETEIICTRQWLSYN
jgi:hypothetical protein